jgi:hypothetical protein
MAGRGPAPKDPATLRRRNKTEPLKVLQGDAVTRGSDLPDDFDWPDATRSWWQTWRESPQAATFTDTDWSFLLDTAVLHAEFWLGNRTLAGELRLRAAKFGATPEDRARLKLEIGEPPAAEGPKRSSGARRQRLLKVVGQDEGG